jgi:hypothetical protein
MFRDVQGNVPQNAQIEGPPADAELSLHEDVLSRALWGRSGCKDDWMQMFSRWRKVIWMERDFFGGWGVVLRGRISFEVLGFLHRFA